MHIFTRNICGDPVIIWEQYYCGTWSEFTMDMVDGTLDIKCFIDGQWKHTQTVSLIGE